MTFVIDLLSNQGVIALVQLLVGKYLKNKEQVSNTIIPFVTFLLAVLGYTVMPATAHAAGLLAPAAPAVPIMAMALVQNLLVTGTHSTFKNAVIPALKVGLGWLAKTFLKEEVK